MLTVGRLSLALASLALFGGLPAFAEEPVETALKGWVAAIDASPDWSANYSGLSYDPATKTAVLRGLKIGTEKPGLVAEFGAISVTAYAQAADGGFSASRIAADKGTITAGPLSMTLTDVELNEFGAPAVGPITWDPQHLFTSAIRAYAPLAKMRLTNGRIGSFDFTEDNKGVKSRISYGQFRIDRWADGKIAGVTAGPLAMESPSPDGLLRMKVASVEGRNIDLDQLLRVYDPGRYAGGVGDMVWHPVMGLAAYHDFAIDGPGLKVSMALLSLENFKLRQPKRSFSEFLDRALANPDAHADDKEAAQAVLSLLSAYGIGRFGISKLDVQATGIDRFHLGGFSLTDLSMDGLGEFAVDDFNGLVRDQGSLKVARFAFGGVVFPGYDVLDRAMQADMAGDAVDVLSVMPKLGFVEAKGIDVATPDVPRTTLDHLRVDLSKYIGPIPTAIVADLGGLVLPVSLIDDADARSVFKKLGYDKIDLSYGLKLGWAEPEQTVKLDELRVALKGAGSFVTSMALVGLPRQAIEHPDTLEQVLPGLKLQTAALTFTDESIVGKGLDLLAEKMHAPAAKFRQQFADAIPFLLTLTALNDPKFMALVKQSGLLARLQPVLKAFIATPGSSITIKLAPPTPLTVAEVTKAADATPERLADLVGLSISTTGTMPAPAPAPQSPPSPANPPADKGGAQKPAQ